MEFSINQIVCSLGKSQFVILAFRQIEGEVWAQVKEVNPNDHSQFAPGEFALPLTALRPLV